MEARALNAPGAAGSTFDFDRVIERAGTHAVKLEGRFAPGSVTPLWVADMDFAAPPCVVDALNARARHPIYGYTAVPESVYKAIIDWHAARHGWHIERAWIVCVPGTLPALGLAIGALTRPGDGVVIQPPVYGPFEAMPRALGRRVVVNPLIEQAAHYRMDLDQLERCGADGARLLLVCSPHNPVGRVWSGRELDAVLAIARRHDMIVFADEVHGDLAYRHPPHISLGTLAHDVDRVVSAVSPGKPFNVQGLPFTALVIPRPELREALVNAIAAHRVDDFSPFALAAAEAAWRDGGPWLDALRAYLQTTRDAMADYVHEHLAPLRLVPPEAGYLAWLDCRGLGLDPQALERFFIEHCHLGLNPGTDYGMAGRGFMRLNFASPRARIMAALEAIRSALHDRPRPAAHPA